MSKIKFAVESQEKEQGQIKLNGIQERKDEIMEAVGSAVPFVKQEKEKPKFLYEDVRKRKANERHFKRSDGKYEAILYSHPIHYLDETTGKYKPIDNSLAVENKSMQDQEDFDGFSNKCGLVKVKLAKSIKEKHLLTVQKGEYSLTWTLLGQKSARGYETKGRYDGKVKNRNGENKKYNVSASEMIYPDCFAGADLQYLLCGNYLKDNIIIKERTGNYEYAFRLSVKNLNLQLAEDGSRLEFYVEEQNKETQAVEKKVEFSIPLPFMTDGAGARSEAVSYEVEKQNDGEYLFKIIADAEWINSADRVLPVVIDPMLIYCQQTSFACAEVDKNTNNASIDLLAVGNIASVGNAQADIARSYLWFNLPTELSNKHFVEAHMCLLQGYATYHASNTNQNNSFEVKKVTGQLAGSTQDWFTVAPGTMTWNNQPTCSFESYARVPYQVVDDKRLVNIDMTKMVKEWLEDRSTNKGFMLQGTTENENQTHCMLFYGLNSDENVDNVGLHIVYQDKETIVSNQQQVNEVFRAGKGVVDLFTQNFQFIHEDVQLSAEKLPLNLQHIYNERWAQDGGLVLPNGKTIESVVGTLYMGRGWKTNYHQYILPYDPDGDMPLLDDITDQSPKPMYMYIDAMGNIITFSKYFTNGQGAYELRDDMNKGLVLTSTSSQFFMQDKKGNRWIFYSDGKLQSIRDVDENIFTVVFDSSGKLTRVIDASGREAYLDYTLSLPGSGGGDDEIGSEILGRAVLKPLPTTPTNLVRIRWNSDNEQILFTYTSGELTKITYQDGTYSQYTYSRTTTPRTFTARDQIGYRLTYTFGERSNGMHNAYVDIKESTNVSKIAHGSVTTCTEIDGNTLKIDFIDEYKTVVTDKSGKEIIYSFDSKGQCNATRSEEYDEDNQKQVRDIQLTSQVRDEQGRLTWLQQYKAVVGATNYVENGGFENSNLATYWSINDSTNIKSVASQEGYGSRVLQMSNDGNLALTATQEVDLMESSYVNKARSFVISGMAKASNSLPPMDGAIIESLSAELKGKTRVPKFSLTAQLFYGDGTSEDRVEARFDHLTSDWQLVSVGVHKSEANRNKTASYVKLTLDYSYNNGIAFFDDIRLTESKFVEQTTTPEYYIEYNESVYPLSSITTIWYYKGGAQYSKATGGNLTGNDVHTMLMQPHQAGVETEAGVILVNGEQITDRALLGNSSKEIKFVLDNGTRISIFDGVKLKSTLVGEVRDEKGMMMTYWTDFDGNTTRTSLKGDEEHPIVTDYVYENGRVVSETNTTCNLKTENTYDTNGRLTATRTRSTAPVNSNNGYNETKAYNSDHLLISSKDHRGFQTTYANDSVYGRMTSVTLPDGQTFNYAYTNNALSGINTTVVNAKTGMTETVAHNFGFTRGLLTRMTVNNTDAVYTFEYDGFGVQTKVYINGVEYQTNSYKTDCDYATATSESDYNYTQTAYANGYTVKNIVNKHDAPIVTLATENGTTQELLRFEYDEYHRPFATTDNGLGGSDEIYTRYYYGVHGNIEAVQTIGARNTYFSDTYDHKDRLVRKGIECENIAMVYEYEYGTVGGAYPDDKLHVVKMPDEQTVTYGYDEMQRMKTRTIGTISETYSYAASGYAGGATTNLVFQIQYSSTGFSATATYEYSARGNILEMIDYSQTVSYQYDGLNRLIRENNQKLGFTATYAYDDMGNIIEKKVHTYTTPGNTPLVTKQTYTFTYGTSGADTNRLLSVTKKILSSTTTYNISSYDLLGNPCNYLGNVLQWGRGRNLMRFGNHTYRYNANGIRMEKTTASGVVHKYWYEGDRLYRELRGTTEILYYYDGTGIEGCSVGGVRYHYQKNAQGDIVRIFNNNGTLAAQYFYDAWGEHNVYNANGAVDNSATFIGNVNPFRYRGYYFDAETGLYYLQSRYYDPQYGRFINADKARCLTPEDLTGSNLYAYCNNNPVMYSDPTGHKAEWWHWLISGLAVVGGFALTITTGGILGAVGAGLITAGANSIINGYLETENGGDFTAGWTGGLITGFIAGFGAGTGGLLFSQATSMAGLAKAGLMAGGVLASFMSGGVASYLGSYASAMIAGTDFCPQEALKNATAFGLLNIITGYGVSIVNAIGAEAGKTIFMTDFFQKGLVATSTAVLETVMDMVGYWFSKLD